VEVAWSKTESGLRSSLSSYSIWGWGAYASSARFCMGKESERIIESSSMESGSGLVRGVL